MKFLKFIPSSYRVLQRHSFHFTLTVLVAILNGCATKPVKSLKRTAGEACTVGGYRAQIYSHPRCGACLEISQQDHVVYTISTRTGGFYIGGATGNQDELDQPSQIEPGTDVLGNGKPNLIITHWEWATDKINREYCEYIFEFSNKVKLLKKLEGGPFNFRYSVEKGRYEIHQAEP